MTTEWAKKQRARDAAVDARLGGRRVVRPKPVPKTSPAAFLRLMTRCLAAGNGNVFAGGQRLLADRKITSAQMALVNEAHGNWAREEKRKREAAGDTDELAPTLDMSALQPPNEGDSVCTNNDAQPTTTAVDISTMR